MKKVNKTKSTFMTRLLLGCTIIALGLFTMPTLLYSEGGDHYCPYTPKSSTSYTAGVTEKLPAHILTMLDEIDAGEAILVDVREKDEWKKGHIKVASLTSLSEIYENASVAVEDAKDTKVYLYCQSGKRAQLAKELLEQGGMDTSRVVALKEGFGDLKALGLEEVVDTPKL